MKTDETGGQPAEDQVVERLSRRYAMELERAERDYPVLLRSSRERVGADGATPGSGRSLRTWRRIAAPMTAVVVLVAVSLVGVGLALRPSAGPAGPSNPDVVRGSDGIPTSIDGQRVYRIGDQSEWKNLSGSFLLGGYSILFAHSCPVQLTPLPSTEHDLVDLCGAGALLASGPSSDGGPGSLRVAPVGSTALDGWAGGPAIVMRVHTHDPEAAQCAADQKAACEAALVVEAVVWPTVPTEINGERVYRDTDWASFPKSGSFLLGGPATKPSVVPPCPAPVDRTTAEQQLIQYCYILTIDGIGVAPMSTFDEPNGEIVVARVHINDSLAAQCPADVQTACAASIVVESVVWRSTEAVATATPSSVGSSTTPSNPASGEGVGPVQSAPVASGPSAGSGSVGPLDGDGVPTTIGGAPVYRAAALPTAPTFLLGGQLTHDTGCAPAVSLAPPVCGYWMVDGVKVGAAQTVPESLSGSLVVARVGRMSDCQHAPCATPLEFLTMEEIVWSGSASAGTGTSVGPLDSDGVPTSIAGTPVYRAAALTAGEATFLLGGALTHDTGCAPTTAAVPPGCGYWMVDGVKVGTMIALPELPSGSLVVARVASSTSLAICPDGKSCPPTRGILVVTEIVWSGPIVEVPPPPVSPGPSAS